MRGSGNRGTGVPVGRRLLTAVASVGLVPLLVTACSGAQTSHDASRSPSRSAAAPRPDPHTADPDPGHLVPGDCFNANRTTLAGGIGKQKPIRIVPCTQPHLAEVFGRFTYVGGAYPAGGKTQVIADLDCANLATGYDMDSWTIDPVSDPTRSFLPTRAQWAAGDLDGICYWVPRAGPTTGRLRRDETTLTADQYTYLDASDRPESALGLSPSAQGDDSQHAYRSWAAGVADSLAAERQLLDNHLWPAPAQGPVNALIQRLDVMTQLWRAASQSASDSDVKRGLRPLLAQTSTPQEQAVRSALGLATAHRR